MTYRSTNLYSSKNILSAAGVTVLYLLVSYLLIGFKTDQLILAGIFNVCYFLSGTSRKFILGFSIFIVYWIIFDYMKAFPNYKFNAVHIQDLYNNEKSLFGIGAGSSRITPNEFWIANQNSFLDVMTGIFYLCWIPVPLAFAAYLFFKDKKLFLQFALTFVFVNFIGFIIYYAYPAAPPWYMQLNGNNFIANTKANTAGLSRFDSFFNVAVFTNLYTKGSNVFAAMPSLHCICSHAFTPFFLSADCVLLRSKEKSKELYGCSVCSGNVGDMVCCCVYKPSLCAGCAGRDCLCCTGDSFISKGIIKNIVLQ